MMVLNPFSGPWLVDRLDSLLFTQMTLFIILCLELLLTIFRVGSEDGISGFVRILMLTMYFRLEMESAVEVTTTVPQGVTLMVVIVLNSTRYFR